MDGQFGESFGQCQIQEIMNGLMTHGCIFSKDHAIMMNAHETQVYRVHSVNIAVSISAISIIYGSHSQGLDHPKTFIQWTLS